MLRALEPQFVLAALIGAVAGIAYGLGAPAWILSPAIAFGLLAALPAYNRWERRHHS